MSSRTYPSAFRICCGALFFGLTILESGPITCTAVAGDLLRGGYSTAPGGATAPGSFTPASIVQQRQNAADLLARTTRAIQSVAAMQSAARKLAISGANNLGIDPNDTSLTLPNVRDGLTTGGLVPSSTVAWTGVNGGKPSQSVTSGGNTVVTVVQTSPTAILTWSSFNIGKNTTLDFNQSAGGNNVDGWIAFNVIRDPSAVPSQILGSIEAPGQVYVINQNGIIFGGSSQVNVHTLVASSLPIDTFLITNGLLDNPDEQFLFSSIAQPAGSNGPSPAFTPPASYLTKNVDGAVTVDPGAEITAPASASNVGGRVALIGPNVTNDGAINTPDGQTILAAGLQVGFVAHPSSDPSLRGLDVYVGAEVDPTSAATPYAGTAINDGMIDAPGADIMITGKTVEQLGDILSTTSVSLNGRIDLLANYDDVSSNGVNVSGGGAPFFQTEAGTVILGANSVSQIVPDLSSDATVVGTELALGSQVNVQGIAINMGDRAVVYAPDATANFDAGYWSYEPSKSAPATQFVYNGGQIYLDPNATIDVAGSEDVPASVLQNIITVQLRGAELAESPLERTSVLEGQNLVVDISQTGIYDGQEWVGTPLGDVFGYVGLIQRSVGELTVDGGTVNLHAGGSVVTQPGSMIDVSGGWIDYAGAEVQTTRLISDGYVYDIADATPDLTYSGIYTGQFTSDHPKYGISETFTSPLALTGAYFDPSYTEGGNGGAINITAPAVALNGDMVGKTAAGTHQLTVQPTPSSLSLSFENQSIALESEFSFPTVDPTPPKIIIGDEPALPAVGAFTLDSSGDPAALPASRQDEVVLSPSLVNSDGFGILDVSNVDGTVAVPAGTAINAPANTANSITIAAANLTIGGSLTVPGGSMNFTVYDYTPLPLQGVTGTPAVQTDRGNFTLNPGASLNAAGLLVDDRDGVATALTTPEVTTGGSITIDSFNADLAAGSSIDVSGGAELSSNGTPSYGNAGTITIESGADPAISSLIGGKLRLDATLSGYSGARGGTLTIVAPEVQVGGGGANSDTLLLSPGFFSLGGFSAYNIGGLGEAIANGQFAPGLVIAPGADIQAVAESLTVTPDGAGGTGVTLTPYLEPEGTRTPVSLSFSAPGVTEQTLNGSILIIRGDLVDGAGSLVQTDPLGSVTLKGQTVAVEGSILAPGGSISISGASAFPENSGVLEALPTVDLGHHSVLSVAGETVLTPNAYGYRTGSVLGGGTITVSGNIVGESGAVLNVSGAADTLDLSPGYSSLSAASGIETVSTASSNTDALDSLLGGVLAPTRVDSSGGSITLTGGQELYLDSTLLGSAGGPSAYGGSLTVSSGLVQNGAQSPLQVTLTVTQSGHTITKPDFYPSGQTAIGNAVDSTAAQGGGHFAVSTFEGGGFANLALDPSGAFGAVQFDGNVSITAPGALNVAGGGVVSASGAVDLTAPYVALGVPFAPPLQAAEQPAGAFIVGTTPDYFLPTTGNGSLTVTASLIDVGTLSLQDIGNVKLDAPGGDIRGDGTLDVAGKLTMTAGQVYAPTDAFFTIDVTNYTTGSGASAVVNDGTITFEARGSRQIPLSAGGEINVYASVINQGGVLRAPLGIINLGWDGGADAKPIDYVTGAGLGNGSVDPTVQLNLEAGSVTSVSQIDPLTGQPVIIPYGLNNEGTAWVDPTNTDITSIGPPAKAVNISAQNVDDAHGAVIDVRGGGDLLAYEFVPGNGGNIDVLGSPASAWGVGVSYNTGDLVSYNGHTYSAVVASTGVAPTVSEDWSLVPQEYAILPGYDADYAPYAPFSQLSVNQNYFDGDAGYVSSSAAGRPLSVGTQVYLQGSSLLPAGVYTLLPARYAVLPGAFLVTPESGTPPGTELLPDGSSLVSGYRFNNLDAPSAQPLLSSFDLAPSSVVNSLAQYDLLSANSFFPSGGSSSVRVPKDSGHVVLDATLAMTIQGAFDSQPAGGGLGALVDINSPANIVIAGDGVTGATGELVLNSSELSGIGAESLLIGGERTISSSGQTVTVSTNNITVDNSGSPLTGSDIILAANQDITVDSGSEIDSSGDATGLSPILVDGNGVLIRVSSDPSATVERTPGAASTVPDLTIDAKAKIIGASVTLDSSYGTSLDPSATIQATDLALNSGQITVVLSGAGPQSAVGLVLSGNALATLQTGVQSLSLLSYSSIDIYGTGQIGGVNKSGQPTLQNLILNTDEILGYDNAGGQATFTAQNVTLENTAGGSIQQSTPTAGTTLAFDAGTILLGANQLVANEFATVNGFANLDLNASDSILAEGDGGLRANNIAMTTPLLTAGGVANETITASGAFTIDAPTGGSAATAKAGGLGATLTLVGASLTENSAVLTPSGDLTLHATAGALSVGGKLDAGGEALPFFDLTKYTNAGQITLMADNGNATLAAGSVVTVAADSGGGNGGRLSIDAPNGQFQLNGTLLAAGGVGGSGGSFSLDAGSLPLDSNNLQGLSTLASALDTASFSQSISIRVRTGDVLLDGLFTTDSFTLSADAGDIDVTGEVNAAGNTGGSINLVAAGSVLLENNAILTVAAQNFNDAQKGGSVSLEAGAEVNGAVSNTAVVNIEAGSTINLTVANASPATGDLAGALLIQAPQIDGAYGSGSVLSTNASPNSGVDLNIAPIAGSIIGASSIVAVGSYVQDADSTSPASIDTYDQNGNLVANSMEALALTNGSAFIASTDAANVASRIIGSSGIDPASFTVEPGEVIEDSKGDLVLNQSWDLSTARFGQDNNIPGILTLRAEANLVFEANASLSDGFNGAYSEATLLAPGSHSWSYVLTGGADFSAADPLQVTPNAAAGSGSVLIGEGSQPVPLSLNNPDSQDNYFQTIRTGDGSIQIAAAGDVELLDDLATIYTAGVQAAAIANFQAPDPQNPDGNAVPAQYSMDGGDVSIHAGHDIVRYAYNQNGNGTLVADSSLEMPNNWLDREGWINPATNAFGNPLGPDAVIESTSWWVDFTNYFEGVGALGGGNVTMVAGNNVTNVDADIPTNERMTYMTATGDTLPADQTSVELGGGDLIVRAGNNISGGVYYVESGHGTLSAGGQIETNATRAVATESVYLGDAGSHITPNQLTWLPTTLFAGNASFDVSANGNILLGPVANVFLLPQGINNAYNYKTYFSTYGAGDAVNVSSLAGSITVRDDPTGGTSASLESFLADTDLQFGATWANESEPWLATVETSVNTFNTPSSLMAPTLDVTAFSGDINLDGAITLAPSAVGNLELFAGAAINGFQPNLFAGGRYTWDSGEINLSEANPDAIPNLSDPLSYNANSFVDNWSGTLPTLFRLFDTHFAESGSVTGNYGVIQSKEALNDAGLLHASDPDPVEVYARDGDISGFTLFAGKFARVLAGQDITDISLYIQNENPDDVSIVAAGGNITLYDPNSPLRQSATLPGNVPPTVTAGDLQLDSPNPNAGDIQIGGGGTLEVFAGGSLNTGLGENDSDGTAVGITSIGQTRDPYLPATGANIVMGAGIDALGGLQASTLDFNAFTNQFLSSSLGAQYFADLAAADPGDGVSSYGQFKNLPAEQQKLVALDLFFLVLRDAGREHNLVGSAGYGLYTSGLAAIADLFGSTRSHPGGIDLTSREVKTEEGGYISLLAPDGSVTVGLNTPGASVANSGVLTDAGGNINIYTEGDVNVGTSRIFTLLGGNEIIWSSEGSIDAGASSKTVQSAPPTQVIVDPQSANVETDLAGLATGGGIGVLAAVAGVPPGSVDLIAPNGVINAGDAGIRATGNLNLAAVQILNASNIQAGGASSGVPVVSVAAPNLGAISAASATAGAADASASQQANNQGQSEADQSSQPSIIDVEVLGYGGGDTDAGT